MPPYARLLPAALAFALMAPAAPADAARADDGPGPLLFMNHSVTLLEGTGYALPGSHITTITFEHVSKWTWGDVFGFLDLLDYHDNPRDGHGWYGEISPRLSLGKPGLMAVPEGGALQDILIAGTFERGKHGTESLLLGLGLDWQVPGFAFVQSNLYARKDTSRGAGFEDMQLTVAFKRPFKIGDEDFVFDGYFDFVPGFGPQAMNFHSSPQIKWDLGAKWGKPGTVYLGTEIDVWLNQFGVKNGAGVDSNQLAINAILKVHF